MCESSNFSISGKSIPVAKSAEGTQGDKSAKDLGFAVVCIWSYFGCGTKHEEATCKQRFDDCVSGQCKEIILPVSWYKVDDFSASSAELMKYCIKPKGQNPYDLDCRKYVDCSDTKAFLKNCHPPSLVFDPVTSQCKWNSELGMADRCKNFKNIIFHFVIFFNLRF